MRVFKFGGASVKDAASVRNVAGIVSNFADQPLFLVVSAMGKTTNALESIVDSYMRQETDLIAQLDTVRRYHHNILADLGFLQTDDAWIKVDDFFVEAEWILESSMNQGYDQTYDQLVSIGELASSVIVHACLQQEGLNFEWTDARDFIRTDDSFRQAKVNEHTSKSVFCALFFNETAYAGGSFITQGFIGCNSENLTTTLGREGSDYSAALIASFASASDLTIWKDVPGVMSADPKKYAKAVLLPALSYQDAVELTYYGATVIHPKTIKPLKNASIPLYVRSFQNPDQSGTEISNKSLASLPIPNIIHKSNQVLLSISSRDFSFMAESHLSYIIGVFADSKITINTMQVSALSFSVCFDGHAFTVSQVIDLLQADFRVLFNDCLQLFTIRNYTSEVVDEVVANRPILLEQRTRNTIQLVLA